MENATTVRILVVGEDNVGKTTLIQALCGASSHTIGQSTAGCGVSIRLTEHGHLQEFYDIGGAPRYRHGRQLFYMQRRYDAVLFVYDITDTSSRSAVSCIWVPEVMKHLGDVGAIQSGGRLDGNDVHVTSAGVISELRFLWRQALLSNSTVSLWQAMREAVRLSWRLAILLLNELGIWTNSSIDLHAERLYLSTSVVPTAIVGMKADLVDRDDIVDSSTHVSRRAVPHLKLHANSVAHDPRLQAFLKRVAENVKRRLSTASNTSPRPNSSTHVLLGFP